MKLLNYKVYGEGRPLIILHGFLGSLDNWSTLAKRFAEEYQVILVDQRNHGKSFHSDEFSYDEMVDDLKFLIEELKLQNPILLGHSMGGKTVMQYSAYYPQKILGMIVADIGPKVYPVHHYRILEGLRAIDLSGLKSRQEADNFLSKYVDVASTRVFLLKNLKRTSEGFGWKMNLPVLEGKIEEIGKTLNYHLPIEVETLFIRGGNSDYILDSDFDSIEEIYPNVQFETVQAASHWLHAEQPDDFYNKVMNFLNNL